MLEDELGILISAPAAAELAAHFESPAFVDAVQVFRGVRMLSHRMSEASTEWLAPHDLTVAQYNFLAALFWSDREAGLSSRNIGRHLHTTSGTVTSMTDTLERAGLVRRTAHSSDRRSIVIKLTPKGRRRFAAAAETQHARVVAALGELSPDEVRALLALLVRAGNSLGGLMSRAADSPREEAG
jgi:DNA-binding MarR family transcriptional regulator